MSWSAGATSWLSCGVSTASSQLAARARSGAGTGGDRGTERPPSGKHPDPCPLNCSHAGSQFSRAGSVPHKKRPPKLANKVRLCRVVRLTGPGRPHLLPLPACTTPTSLTPALTRSFSPLDLGALPALFCFLYEAWDYEEWDGDGTGGGVEQGSRHPKSTVFCCVLSSRSPVITSGPRSGLHQSALSAGNYHCSGGGHGLQVTCLLGSGEAGLENRATP